MLDDRTVQLLEDLDEQETRLNGRLARSQALFNAAAATRKEMDEFRLRAESKPANSWLYCAMQS